MTPDSDIDLLVLERDVGDPRAEGLRIRQTLAGLPFAFDVIVMASERFEETRDVIGGIAPALADSVGESVALTPFGVEARYPGDLPEPTVAEAEEAVEIAERVRDCALDHLPSEFELFGRGPDAPERLPT